MVSDLLEDMDVENRRSSILDILAQEGKVKVIELSKLFNLSEVTIRNDLADLDEAMAGFSMTNPVIANRFLHVRDGIDRQYEMTGSAEVTKFSLGCAVCVRDCPGSVLAHRIHIGLSRS